MCGIVCLIYAWLVCICESCIAVNTVGHELCVHSIGVVSSGWMAVLIMTLEIFVCK